ncbi:MAG: TonB-dependent receptor [Prevotellaceae bacterium]|jgi:TonB-linked SusC/RagA family outer membrane protein|nr:TonB-dependent receptor [Prevotellaceae bacterium]
MNFKKYFFIGVLLLAPVALLSQAQRQYEISGSIFDENSEQMAGASVYIKNTTVGIVTDNNGHFSIKAPLGSTIIFSFIGYEQFDYFVEKDEPDLKVVLRPKAELEEVIVTALGSQRKISSVGAITTIDPQELQTPASSIANIIGGRMAGIINMQKSGEPGKNISEFWVRGIGTFGASTSALVLIDGLEGDLNSIDPADIESFSILKDASATAVYGVRGANGVVLVTTRRGGESRLKIMARVNVTLSSLNKIPQYAGAYDYASLFNEALAVRGNMPKYTQREMDVIRYHLDNDMYPDVDWQKESFRKTGLQHTYYLSGQGGTDVAKYFVSLSMSNEGSAYRMDKNSRYRSGVGYNTYGFRLNLDVKLTSTTQMYFGTDSYLTRRKQPGVANTDYIWYAQSALTPLLIPTVYSTGQLPAYGPDNLYSPYVMLNHTGNSSQQTYNGKITLALNQDLRFLLEGLKIRIQGAYDNNSHFNERRYVLPEMFWATGRNIDGRLMTVRRVNAVSAQYSFSQRQYRKYHFESTVNYEKILNRIHRFSGLLYYYMSDYKDTNDIGQGTGVNTSMSAIPKRYQGLSGRVTYALNDTYLLDVNFGYTGSENFQPGRRFGFFPSIALGWVPSQYRWISENLPWIGFFKIRGSYGLVGSDRISSRRFPYLTILNENSSTAWSSGYAGISESSIGADNLMWEKARKADLGIDARLFNGKVEFTVDFFNDMRDGIFQQRQSIPDYAGLLAMPYGNVGKMVSYGSDGNVSFSHSFSKNLSFTVRGNFTYSRNRVENWEQAPQKYPYQALNGYTNGAWRGYIALGLFRDEQDVASSPVHEFGGKILPGDIKYKDVNGDGRINTDDRVALSDPTYPRLMYGFGGEVKYRNFTLGVLFKGTGHTPFYHVGQDSNGMGYVPFHGGETGNVLTVAVNPANRWIPRDYAMANGIDPALAENPDARFPRLDFAYNSNNSQLSTFWKSDSWYLRLQEITLNYHFRQSFLNRIGISSMDLQFVGSNLYVWDRVKLWDPEQAHLNGQAYPIPARYTLQLYINF